MSSTDIKTNSELRQLPSGKQLYVVTSEPSQSRGDPIVFLHGLGSNTSFYEAPLQLSELAKTRTVVRYDFDGHGLSPVSSDKVTIATLAEDVKGVLQALKYEKASIVAHSMSGLVALTFAATYPQLVEKLCLLGPVKAMPEQGKQNMRTRASTVRSSGMGAIVPSIQATALSKHTLATSPLSSALLRALVLPTPPEGYAKACEALASAENPDFSRVEAETLVVAGEHDYMSSIEVVDAIVSGIQNGRSVTMEGIGHWHAIEQPVELAKILDDYFL